MKPSHLLLRCYAEQAGDQWVAVCIDLGLAAQRDTYREVRRALDGQIYSYLYDALIGEDRAYADQLLTRKAPWPQILRYYLIKLQVPGLSFGHKVRRFISNTPVVPRPPHHLAV
ncbi:MAG: hypothetical protein WBJ41_14875 [Chromatiaceae bacterium]